LNPGSHANHAQSGLWLTLIEEAAAADFLTGLQLL
jgi:hypothetical protein